MRSMWNFFKTKGFYIALGTGLVAFATLLAVYNYTSVGNELTKERGIDLNQPVVANTDPIKKDSTNDQNVGEIATASDVAENVDKTATSNATENMDKTAKKDVAENVDNTTKEMDGTTDVSTKPVTAEATAMIGNENVAEKVDDTNWSNETPELVPSLEYDGEQYLVWPVVGNVILPFSMETTVYFQTLDMYKCNPGILIQGEEGLDVISAYEGVVESVEDTKEYGTVVSVEMGNGYVAKYGQLMNVCVSKGDNVAIAQTIGEIAPPSKYYTEEGSHLYFAITKDGEPVNPILLIQ